MDHLILQQIQIFTLCNLQACLSFGQCESLKNITLVASDGRTTTHALLLASQSPLVHGLLLDTSGQELNLYLILPDFSRRDLENLDTLLMEGEILVRNVARLLSFY